MKRFLIFFLFLTAGILGSFREKGNVATTFPTKKPAAKETIVYVVRHAEKSGNHPTNPDLNAEGKKRAEALKNYLANEAIKAVYSTDLKRTEQTARPVAKAKNLTIITYNPGDLAALAAKILKENRNQTVLIVGHSNTVLETIEAFKAPRPVPQLTDSDYNYLFKVTIPEKGTPTAETKRYGN